jgi:inosine-uridine nucleoside N-ribohydrolase
MSKKTLIVDCDTGIDDAIALLYLLASPDVEICAITTVYGNTSAAQAARNTLGLLELVGRSGEIPVAVGSEAALTGARTSPAAHVHGDDGLGGAVLPVTRADVSSSTAVEMIIDTARRRAGEVHLVTTAPLTNVATALSAEPRLPQLLAGVTVMGGAAMVPGNVTPAAEANVWRDPEAAQAVVTAPWPVMLVPLDATMQVVTSEEQRLRMAGSSSAVAQFAAAALDHYFDFYASVFGHRCSPCHDVLAAAMAIGEVVAARSVTVPVMVETGHGPGRGATICDTRATYGGQTKVDGATCTVVLEAAGDPAREVVERLCSFAPGH